MKYLRHLAAVATLAVASPAFAVVAVFDFESLAPTTGLSTLTMTEAGVTATLTRPGNTFEIADLSAELGIIPAYGTRGLAPFDTPGSQPFVMDFSTLLTSVSVDMGDFAVSDIDTLSLMAYSGAGGTGTLLGSVSSVLPNFPDGFHSLTVSVGGAGIQSIVMIGGSTGFPNSVYYDNITVTTAANGAVPEAGSTVALLGLTLIAIGLIRRRLAA